MTYAEQHAALVQYLKVKAEQGDWHAVRDAAADLELLEAVDWERRKHEPR